MAARANFGIGIPIALFFLIGGIAFWIVIPDVLIGQIWVGVSLLLLLIFGALARAGAKAARIRLEGIQGTATLLGMEKTGVYVNEQPQVRLRLRVEAPGLEPYEVEKREVVPMIALSGELDLKRLLDEGAITQEEHDNKRKEILAEL